MTENKEQFDRDYQKEYKVIVESDIQQLENSVNHLLDQGFRIYQPMIIDSNKKDTTFIQPMMKVVFIKKLESKKVINLSKYNNNNYERKYKN